MGPPREVNCTVFDPPASQIQISRVPPRPEGKAMRLPPGEKDGFPSDMVEAMKRAGGPALPPGAVSPARQMLMSEDLSE